MRCAIYTRVSTDEQARSEYSSLDRQQEVCAAYIEIHREKGWHVVQVYEDGGYSGKDLNRPGIQELIQDLSEGKIDAIVTYKIDRISRSLKDFYDFWEVLKASNVTFASATQHFDTSDSAGMLMLNILLSFAQYERELTRERTLSKMAGRAAKGLWNGGPVPLGFDYSPDSQELRPNDEEAPIIRFVFDRFLETHSPSTVAREANSRGYRTKRRVVVTRDGSSKAIGGNRFDEDTIAAVIRNPLYKGFIRFDGEVHPGNHQPLVDVESWEAANRVSGRIREEDRGFYKDDHVHLLKGLIKCGVCGTTMTPYPAGKKDKAGNPYLYYSCTSVTQDGSASKCPVRSVPAREFESLIKNLLSDLGRDRAILQACADVANREAVASVDELRTQQRKNHEELARLTTDIRRIIEFVKANDEVPADMRAEFNQLTAEKERLTTEVEKLQVAIDRRQARVLDVELIGKSLVDFERLVNLLPVQDQKELFQLLLKEVKVHPFDPARESAGAREARGVATKVRSKWFRVEIAIHQLPGVSLAERFESESSEKRGSGSPTWIRTTNTAVNSRVLYR